MKEHYEDEALINTIYYVRDVAGQVMTVYNDVGGDPALEEQPVYGAGRIGVAYNGNNNEKTYVYELTDHLGNVRAVFTKAENDADLEGYTDYYPGGMAMPNRNLEDANGYRFGYQGQYAEEDKETGLNAFQLRMYDSRILRWLSPDPYGQFNSPYLAMGNNWSNMTDPDGGYCPDCPNEGDTITQGYIPGDTYNSSDGNTYMLLEGDFGWSSSPEVVMTNLTYPLSGNPLNSTDGIFSTYNFEALAGTNMATFNAGRSNGRRHAARDLYTDAGANVFSIGSGEVLSVGAFYAGTNQVTVRHYFSIGNNTVDAIVRYGELSPASTDCLTTGDCINQGDILGETGSLLRANGTPVLSINNQQIYMLHLEVYSGVMGYDLIANPLTNRSNTPFQRRTDLVDANELLRTIGN